jgi:hypothetical protein
MPFDTLKAIFTRELAFYILKKSELLLALGGSYTSNYRTPVSDVDLFVIADEEDIQTIQSHVPAIPKVDIETRSTLWLNEICHKLVSHQLSLSGHFPNFDIYDLRFLARVLVGERLISCDCINGTLGQIEAPLCRVLAQYQSILFTNAYQDVYGLYICGRFDEAVFVAPALIQAACLLALLNTDLVDPSPKWAIQRAMNSDRKSLSKLATSCAHHLRSVVTSKDWVEGLLLLARAVVATSIINQGSHERIMLRDFSLDPKLSLALAPMGLPAVLTILDVESLGVHVCNNAALEQMLYEATFLIEGFGNVEN